MRDGLPEDDRLDAGRLARSVRQYSAERSSVQRGAFVSAAWSVRQEQGARKTLTRVAPIASVSYSSCNEIGSPMDTTALRSA